MLFYTWQPSPHPILFYFSLDLLGHLRRYVYAMHLAGVFAGLGQHFLLCIGAHFGIAIKANVTAF
jgi:hypothetical protein